MSEVGEWSSKRQSTLLAYIPSLPTPKDSDTCYPHLCPSPSRDVCLAVENNCELKMLWACELGKGRLIKTRETAAWSNCKAEAHAKTN